MIGTVNLDEPTTQRVFAQIVGLSEGAVSQMVGDGLLERGRPVGEWIVEYCLHLRETAAGRLAAGDLDLATERARLAKEQADRVGMANAEKRRELAPVVLMTAVLAKAGTQVSGILDAIPGQVRRRVPALPASEIEAIRGEIAKARNLCAAMRLHDLDDDGGIDEAP